MGYINGSLHTTFTYGSKECIMIVKVNVVINWLWGTKILQASS